MKITFPFTFSRWESITSVLVLRKHKSPYVPLNKLYTKMYIKKKLFKTLFWKMLDVAFLFFLLSYLIKPGLQHISHFLTVDIPKNNIRYKLFIFLPRILTCSEDLSKFKQPSSSKWELWTPNYTWLPKGSRVLVMNDFSSLTVKIERIETFNWRQKWLRLLNVHTNS